MSMSMKYLRKHQKAVLVVTGVLIIFVFTVGSYIIDSLDRATQAEMGGTTVVTWKGGKANELELQQMIRNHYRVNVGLAAIAQAAMAKGAVPSGLGVFPQQGRYGIRPFNEQTAEEDVVSIHLLAEKARSMGMSISDEAIKQFLYRLSGDQLKDGEIHEILRNAFGGDMSDLQFFAHLRTELLAMHMTLLAGMGLEGGVSENMYVITPGEAFAYFERLNRQAQIESLPVKVEDYVAKVTDKPSEKELRALYEEYKDQIDLPDDPQPGFRVPPRIAIQFVKADFNKFLEEEKAKITDEQVQAEYDRRVAQGDFKVPELPETPMGEAPKGNDALESETEKPDDPATPPANETPDADETPAADNEKKTDDANKDDSPAPPADEPPMTEDKADESEPATDNPPADAPQPGNAPDESSKQNDAGPENPSTEIPDEEPAPEDGKTVALVSNEVFVNTEDEEGSDTEPATADDSTPPPADAPAPSDDKPADSPATDEQPAEDKPSEEKTADDKPTDNKLADEKPADAPPADETPASPAKPKIRPLSEVSEEIKNSLAAEPAQKRIDAAFAEIEKAVAKFARDNKVHRREEERRTAESRQQKAESEAPELLKLDLDNLARKHGLEFETLPLTDPFAMEEYEIARAVPQSANPFTSRFVTTAFSQTKQIYRPEQVTAMMSGQYYLYWITQQAKEYVPTYEEAREKVIDAWKLAKAREYARQAAEEMAAKVKEGQTLAEVFGETKVTKSGNFSWMRESFVPWGMGPTISPVDGIDMPGPEFMQTVFQLAPGEVGVAPNQPQNVYYVVRVVSHTPSKEILREAFVMGGAQRVYRSVMPIAMQERSEVQSEWMRQLDKEFNVQWHRDPGSRN